MTTVSTTDSFLMPVLFVPHGGGPMPLLGDINYRELTVFMQEISRHLARPKAILVITAHWEESVVTLTSHPAPGMLFDYYGFPPESYQFNYPAPGHPELAEQVARLLAEQGIESRLDSKRGFDHGTFVPLMLMYPHADIPVIQMSLIKHFDPARHMALGRALASLREQGVLILGSGMSFHNMQAFFSHNPTTKGRSEQFDNWLSDTLCSPVLTQSEREVRMQAWTSAPEARFCHPREEHLLPLHICYGAGSVASLHAEQVFSTFLFNTKISAFVWR